MVFTACASFSFYYYQKEIAGQIQKSGFGKLLFSELWILVPPLAYCLFAFFTLDRTSQIWILFCLLMGLLYHNHGKLYLFRKARIIKNMVIAWIWIALAALAWMAPTVPVMKTALVGLDFFLLILAQSFLFDRADRKVDQTTGHQTFGGSLHEKNLILLVRILVATGMVLLWINHELQWITSLSMILQWVLYGLYFTPLLSILVKAKKQLLYWTDALIVLKALLLLV